MSSTLPSGTGSIYSVLFTSSVLFLLSFSSSLLLLSFPVGSAVAPVSG